MRQLVTLLVLAALGFFAYNHFSGSDLSSRLNLPWRSQGEAIGVSRVIEPFYNELFGQLVLARPVDLKPPLQTIKKRFEEMHRVATPDKQAVYGQAVALLNHMIPLAEERSKALDAAFKGATTKGTLDGPKATNTTTGFFARISTQRWDNAKAQLKPRLDQMFAQLRAAEFEWNRRAGNPKEIENYDLPAFQPVWITGSPGTALDTPSPSQRRSSNPWAGSSYDANAYPASRPGAMR